MGTDSGAITVNRRDFLRLAAGAGALGWIGASCSGRVREARHASWPRPCSPQAWTKHGIVLQGIEPWEGNNIQSFTCRAEPLENERWRIWYSASGGPQQYNIGYAEGVPGEGMKRTAAVLSAGEPAEAPLALGNLPEGWRPVQAVHLRLRNGRHRLYFWAHGKQICRYLVAESDDGRRYRVLNPWQPVLYHPNDRASFGVASPDGVMYRREKAPNRPANEPLAVEHLISNDATNIYQLPDGTFELYTVALVQVPRTDPAYIAEDNAPGLLRVIDRFVSDDGLHFENRRRVVQRDPEDPVDQQFYYLSVTHTPRGRVGMLGHFRCAAQTMDLEWCFSKDGLTWERPLRRPWIQRGDAGAPDSYGIYAPSQLVYHQNRWHLFYTGVNSTHNGKQSHGTPRQVVAWATTEKIWA